MKKTCENSDERRMYEQLVVKVIAFDTEDIITDSPPAEDMDQD